jgi:hypothetical protein
MRYLLIENENKTFTLLSPETYGMDSWGSSSQESINKKEDDKWYFHYWSDGGQWLDDTNEEFDAKVVLETTDIDEILRYVSKNNESELEHVLQDAKIIYNDYIDFTLWYIKN